MKRLFIYFSVFLFGKEGAGQSISTHQDTISTYFEEIKMAAQKENKLWDIDLYGPILLVNSNTRQSYSNSPDSAGILKKDGKIYSGKLPDEINISSTSINWNGNRWAMIILPLPTDKYDRIDLLAHELFHKAQPALGFQSFNVISNHLDQKEGRIYLRLELEALRRAVNAVSASELKTYITDALTFRKYRYSIYRGADSAENFLELNEGLAEYSGFIISHRNKEQAIVHFNQRLKEFLSNPSYVRSFAYQTIPIYGYLLQFSQKYWNKKITIKTNLTDYFINAFGIRLKSDLQPSVERSLSKYDGQVIIAQEIVREENIKKLVSEYKRKFIEDPHLEIQFEQMHISFDYRDIMPIEDKGTVYPSIRVSDKWGILTVSKGALMSPDWDKITITVPIRMGDKNISGDGWTLSLNEGYKITKDSKDSNYKLMRAL
jgi:hypothetical protein